MLRILFVILLFSLTSCRPSQKEYVDSFDIPLIRQNNELRSLGEYDSLIRLNKKYYQFADKMGYEDGKALCYINLANINMGIGDYQQSQILFKHAEKILENSESTIHKAIFYSSYGQYKLFYKSYKKNKEYNNMALDYTRKSKESWLKNYTLINIYNKEASLYVKEHQYSKALEYYHKTQKLDETWLTYNNIGDFYLYYQENLDSAQVYLAKALVMYNQSEKKDHGAVVMYTTMGEYYSKIKNYDEAEKMFLKALEIDKLTKRTYKYDTHYIYRQLCTIYKEKGNKQKAYFYLRAYLDAVNKTNVSMLAVINHDMNEFIDEAERSAQKERNKTLLLILIGFTVFAFSGVYSSQVIGLLRKKKIKLKSEAEKLKGEMDNTVRQRAIELAKQNDPSFLQTFREAYPGFTERVLEIDPNLEDSELVFCAMLKLHFSSKEIAGYTSVQHRTVQQKKYRIRKKLNIPQETDTYLFFDQLL